MKNEIPISVFIITFNEADKIAATLDRLKIFPEIVVVDCGSTDGTFGMANRYENVKIHYNEWPGFSKQKEFAMSLCTNDWVLNIDADELLTEGYIREAINTVRENKWDALESNRTLLQWGVQPRSFHQHDRLIRLFRKSCGHYETRRVHESISITGRVKRCEETILHCENLSYTERVSKANKYSQLRAEDKFDKGNRVSLAVLLIIFPLSFLQCYIFKGYFLGGVKGMLTSMNSAFYAFMKYAKLWEMRNVGTDCKVISEIAKTENSSPKLSLRKS